MNWKKLLLIGLAVSAIAFTTAPRAKAGISVGIGSGIPSGFGCYGYRYPAYYPYDYYGYGPRRVVYVAPRYYWHHSRRVYYPRRHHRYWR